MAWPLKKWWCIGPGASANGPTRRARSIDRVAVAGRLMGMNAFAILAQLDAPPLDWEKILYWGFVMIGVAIIGFGAIMFFRRKFMAAADADNVPGFSLAELREMRDRGEMTPEEYEQTRARGIAKVKAKMNEPRPSKAKPPVEDEGADAEG